MRTSNWISGHCQSLLEKKQQAIIYTALFSVLPFASWISVALICLVTLRKGARAGFDLLLPALVVHSIPLLMLMPLPNVLVNTLVTYLPCFFAAVVLRKTQNWQFVFGLFLAQASVGCLFIQLLIPDFIIGQFHQLKLLLMNYPEVVDSMTKEMAPHDIAQLFLGVQILSVIFSAVMSLMFARSIQSKLFLPGGFKKEILSFRSGKLSLLFFIATGLGAYYQIPIMINLLPLMMSYFLMSGFSLMYFIFPPRDQAKVMILLILLILMKPAFVLLAYVVLGSLDSLFNFRSYLPERMKESV